MGEVIPCHLLPLPCLKLLELTGEGVKLTKGKQYTKIISLQICLNFSPLPCLLSEWPGTS